MDSQVAINAQRVTGALLTLSFFVFLVGGLMFWARNGMAGNPAPNFAYFVVERGFVAAAAVIAAIGLWLLATILGDAHGDALAPARLAAAAFAIATALLVVGEASRLQQDRYLRAPVVAYVILAFLTQAALGVILVRTGFLPAWIGWATIAWNLAWLIVLPIVTPRDIFYPVLHHFLPLLAGIALLRRG